jgi:hypothetical protein
MPYLHELMDRDNQIAEWRRIHAHNHAQGKRFGGAKKPWPKCTVCQQEVSTLSTPMSTETEITQHDIDTATTVRELDAIRLRIGGRIKAGDDTPELQSLYAAATRRALTLKKDRA